MIQQQPQGPAGMPPAAGAQMPMQGQMPPAGPPMNGGMPPMPMGGPMPPAGQGMDAPQMDPRMLLELQQQAAAGGDMGLPQGTDGMNLPEMSQTGKGGIPPALLRQIQNQMNLGV